MALASEGATRDKPWWSGGVIYHIYLRSFADGNGDGLGDLIGARSKLRYLADLGVDGIWLSPSMPSPDCDWGYDVSDYLDTSSSLGGMEAMEAFLAEADALGIKVLLDLIPNHTSDQHRWFQEAIGDRSSKYRDYYLFAKAGVGGAPPNNWLDNTGKSAWTKVDQDEEYLYMHNYLESQPDLNWWNEEVHREFEEILKFWFDRGVAGFRIDVAHGLYKDRYLRDNPPLDRANEKFGLGFGYEQRYNKNQPEVHQIYRRWREISSSYDQEKLLLGETWVASFDRLKAFYGSKEEGLELQLPFNFRFTYSDFSPLAIAEVIEETLAMVPDGAEIAWTGSNHDISRFPSRWCNGDNKKIRMAMTLLMVLPGTTVIYYGDELGLVDGELDVSKMRDEMTARVVGARFQRDRARLPMPWSKEEGFGFTNAGVEPWLPFYDSNVLDVETQITDKSSNLLYMRKLIEVRKSSPSYVGNDFAVASVDSNHLLLRSGMSYTLFNFADSEVVADVAGAGTVISSITGEESDVSGGETFYLQPSEALIFSDGVSPKVRG
ncbi:MAG: alpha-amylase family glycosyl hydrolase [Actinomycetota bacterium]|nr:alpha-amylase family glycosyl hydrolase [Actinomycetota bacterium]